MEGSVVYGLSAALRGEITFAKGAAIQDNFHVYEPLRISEMPKVETHIVPSTAAPGGIGEPGLPPSPRRWRTRSSRSPGSGCDACRSS